MTESQLQGKFIKYLEGRGHYVVKTIRVNKKGVPDLLICTNLGEFVGIEVKRCGFKQNTTLLQQYQIQEINKAGGRAFVADSIEDLKEKGL